MVNDPATGALCPFDFEQIAKAVPEIREFGFSINSYTLPEIIDSSDLKPALWADLCQIILDKYDQYSGFVILHGTDTMAYTAAAFSYLIQNNRKPEGITGAQKPIDLAITDARSNLLDSLRFAADDRAHGVVIVFGGKVIAGTRAKKIRSKSYNAFSSINYPDIASIHDKRIIFYIDDKEQTMRPLKFGHAMNSRIFLLKLVPGMNGSILDALINDYDGVSIESFGVGGLPNYGDNSFYNAIERWMKAGKFLVMATQVTHEGSDMSVYQVGKELKERFPVFESYDMTLEATVTKMMWALAKTKEQEAFEKLFYQTINHDILFR